MKKLTALDGALDRYFERIEPLRKKVGVVLWQLPPMLRKDAGRLESFLQLLPPATNTRSNFGMVPG